MARQLVRMVEVRDALLTARWQPLAMKGGAIRSYLTGAPAVTAVTWAMALTRQASRVTRRRTASR